MSKVYEVITDRIISLLEKGTVPWHKPWKGNADAPRNLTTMKEYRGVNVFVLGSAPYDSPYWLTFVQAHERGGRIKKGEKGWPVVYWKRLNQNQKSGGSSEDEEEENPAPAKSYSSWRKGFHLYHTVFNSEQCEGIETPSINVEPSTFSPLELCERVAEGYPSPKPLVEKNHGAAFYRPSTDLVGMPKPERFDRSEDFYSMLFHELTHSTGHSSRLNRKEVVQGGYFGSNDYSREELVAEMGAAFLDGHCGIESKLLDNSVAYINNWLKNLDKDPRLVVQAGAQAQRASDYILGVKYSENGANGNGNGVEYEGAD